MVWGRNQRGNMVKPMFQVVRKVFVKCKIQTNGWVRARLLPATCGATTSILAENRCGSNRISNFIERVSVSGRDVFVINIEWKCMGCNCVHANSKSFACYRSVNDFTEHSNVHLMCTWIVKFSNVHSHLPLLAHQSFSLYRVYSLLIPLVRLHIMSPFVM